MSRETEFLNLYLPEDNDYYRVEEDQNQNFEKIDRKLKEFYTNRTNQYKKNDSSFLLDTKGSNQLYEDVIAVINALDKCPYKIGDMYITTNSQNPALTWAGTTWQKIEGRFLRATNGSEAAGTTSGSDSKTLTVANLPSHNHTARISTSGNHTHAQSAHSHTQPAHVHGTLNSSREGSNPRIGYYTDLGRDANQGYGFYTQEAGGDVTGAAQPVIGYSGDHSHGININYTGNGVSFDIKPAYITVHIWKRLS